MDPTHFLAQHAPFDALSQSGRDRIADALEITFARAGERILERGDTEPLLHIVRKGHVRLELDGQQVAHLGPGQLFGLTSIGGGEQSLSLDVVAESDCLLYRLPGEVVRTLCDAEPAVGQFFFDSLAQRLRKLADAQAVALTGDLGLRLSDLVRREPVTLPLHGDPSEGNPSGVVTLADAARTMEAERVSSVLLMDKDPKQTQGIVTDRDLRRALARGLGPDTPVTEVMTSPVELLDAETPGAEALLHLMASGRHHLVFEAASGTAGGTAGELAGVVTHSDLLRRHLQSPGALLDSIRTASRPEDLTDYADRVAVTIETLQRSGVETTDVGRVVAALNDALSSRLLSLAEEELGPRPCEFAWIVFGSEGRQEQSFLTDQDNALVYDADSETARRYFEQLAEHGVRSLLKVGFPECKGGFMATHWCLSLAEWQRRFRSWIDQPEPENLMSVANFFDWRSVHGALDLAPLEAIVSNARNNRRFLAQLARASMRKRPPLGLLRRIVEDEGGVDLKSGALMPISGLARLFALEAGERAGSTRVRLRRAARAGSVSQDGAELLTEAFRFTFGLRLRRQLAERTAGLPITNHVALEDLSAGERRHLKEAFLAVERMQKATELRFGTGALG